MSSHAPTPEGNTSTSLFPPAGTMGRLAISNSGFVFDPVTGASHTVNSTGLALLRLLQTGNGALEDIVARLAQDFEADANVLERDVIEFSARLRGVFK